VSAGSVLAYPRRNPEEAVPIGFATQIHHLVPLSKN
jgi:hypothetical protein